MRNGDSARFESPLRHPRTMRLWIRTSNKAFREAAAIVGLCLAAALLPSIALRAVAGSGANQAAPAIPAKLVDVTSTLGVRFEHAAPHTSKKYLLETMGSGVALFDYDN